jgi:hypothetical protein
MNERLPEEDMYDELVELRTRLVAVEEKAMANMRQLCGAMELLERGANVMLAGVDIMNLEQLEKWVGVRAWGKALCEFTKPA